MVVDNFSISSSRSEHRVRNECSKLTCFAKRMLVMGPGPRAVGNEMDDRRRLLLGIAGVLVRSKTSWARVY